MIDSHETGTEKSKLLEEYRGFKYNNLTDSLFDMFGQFFHKIYKLIKNL